MLLRGPQGRPPSLSPRMGTIEVSNLCTGTRIRGVPYLTSHLKPWGETALQRLRAGLREKSGDCGRAAVGRSEAPQMPCGQGKGGAEGLVWSCC